MQRFLLIAIVTLATALAAMLVGLRRWQERAGRVTPPRQRETASGAPVAAAPPPGQSGPPQEMIDKALALVAERERHRPDQPVTGSGHDQRLPALRQACLQLQGDSTPAPTSSTPYRSTPTARRSIPKTLLAGEEAAYTDKYGNLDAELFDQLASAPPDEPDRRHHSAEGATVQSAAAARHQQEAAHRCGGGRLSQARGPEARRGRRGHHEAGAR